MIETLAVGKLKWHHITDPTEEDFVELKEKFHFHPLDIEDCRSVNQRPKIDIYDDYYFLILQYPDFDRQDKFIFPKEVKHGTNIATMIMIPPMVGTPFFCVLNGSVASSRCVSEIWCLFRNLIKYSPNHTDMSSDAMIAKMARKVT